MMQIEPTPYNEEEDFIWISNPKLVKSKENTKENPAKTQKEPKGTSKDSPLSKTLQTIDHRVKKVRDQIVTQQIRKTCEKVVEIIEMVKDETRKVFFVNFSKGQTLDLDRFVREMMLQCKKKWSNNVITIVKIKEEDVMSILMKIFTYMDENKGVNAVFLIQRITNFDYKDIRSLRRSLDHGQYSIIIPTYKSLIEVDGLNYSGFYHLALYNHKQLLVEFMVRMLLDPTVKPCFPPQIIQLVSDLDFYPLSYRECVRRYNISLKRIIMYEYQNNHKPYTLPNYSLIYNIIVDVLSECTPRGEVKIQDRFVKAVYNKNHVFRIPRSILDVVLTKEEKVTEKIKSHDYNNLDRIIKKVKKRFSEEASLKKYAAEIGEFPELVEQPIKTKNPKDRLSMLQIPKSVTEKSQYLNKQITKVIHEVTEDVRKHASKFPWKQISYDSLCRPELIVQIYKDVNETPKLKNIFNYISKGNETGHKECYAEFDLKLSEYHYLMAELEFLGLIENSKKQIDPSFINQLYKKVDYRIEK